MYSKNLNTLRRLNVLTRILSSSSNLGNLQLNLVRAINIDGRIKIGDVEKDILLVKNPEYVPQRYYEINQDGSAEISQTNLHHLRWMLQKDRLGQDMFILGRPGPLRRSIAMQYLQLTNAEIEYVALSRDTTESDLKQRREILGGTATYFDQSAVRAAVEGRVLVIEGVEKAERNVLPVLNNLLENREMHLEDGRFLIPAERYDKLLKTHSQDELNKWGLVRVSENFRVIALGLPVPKYRGAPLDPPLRSRFQARDVTSLSYQEMFKNLKAVAPQVSNDSITKILSFSTGVLSSESVLSLPDFPADSLHKLAQILENNKFMSEFNALYRLYPYRSFLPKESAKLVVGLFESLSIEVQEKIAVNQQIVSVKCNPNNFTAQVQIGSGKNNTEFSVPCGNNTNVPKNHKFVDTEYQKNLLADIMQTHAVGDYCLIGPKGSGKSAVVTEVCKRLNQTFEPMVLYQDMTARDLIQQRTTEINGDTVWRDSPLVRAAKEGHIGILDGVHRIHNSTIAILHRLVHDRELQLYDGKRLTRHDKYDALLESGFTEQQLTEKGILRIHPSFRIVALAEPPILEAGQNWLTPEMLSLFLFHEVRQLSQVEEINIIQEMYGSINSSMKKIITLAHLLRESSDPLIKNLAGTLSTRQLLRIARRMSIYANSSENDPEINSTYEIIQNSFLAKFLPQLPRAALESAIAKCDIFPEKVRKNKQVKQIIVDAKSLQIGNTKVDIQSTDAITKVPDILFYNVPQHINLLEQLLQDFNIGSHLLLVGNQGVGKNKIADRLLQLMNRPREYIQLHRDTTVQTLTLQPNIIDGVVVYEDSPLVKAVKNGHILVIDEADKAPTHVTCILKTLVENGQMTLSDGRKIIPPQDMANAESSTKDNLIFTHPNFRMIVLANRPGFPFLGNDFFASLGDLFSCHSVDNPLSDSEVLLLQQYGPDVPMVTIKQLVHAFSELRQMADVGQLSYPYSTREVVNIVKHLQKYPNEDMSELVGNVLDFDRHTPESLEQVVGILQKHGLKIESYAKNELAIVRRERALKMSVERFSGKGVSEPKHGKVDPKNEPHVGGNTWAGGTGGRDTAGLGGKGGPYRLDAGHQVHQLSDEEKNDIPNNVKEAAREMNRKAFEDKLKEIRMSVYDHSVYEQFSVPVRREVQNLRVILNSLQAKSKERHWLKHQTSGELDDTKLIEGITGERGIYRRRLEQEPEPGQPQEKPKRLKLVIDVSGSMYRFNGYDGRLDRELEAITMVMEAFDGFEQKVKYDIVGHSGEAYVIPFVDQNNPPKDDKTRLEKIKMMHAHAQYCWSGDHTVHATKYAVDELAKEDCDEAIVIVLSDANLSRYGISAKLFNDALMKQEPKVQSYVIFIGSLGEEAQIIKENMQAGRSFICMNLQEMPQILKQIFASSVLKQTAM